MPQYTLFDAPFKNKHIRLCTNNTKTETNTAMLAAFSFFLAAEAKIVAISTSDEKELPNSALYAHVFNHAEDCDRGAAPDVVYGFITRQIYDRHGLTGNVSAVSAKEAFAGDSYFPRNVTALKGVAPNGVTNYILVPEQELSLAESFLKCVSEYTS